MRYDVPIYFQRLMPGEYNRKTGDYKQDTVKETMRYASVMDTGSDTLMLVYGGIRQGSLTLHLQCHDVQSFVRFRIANSIYRVDQRRTLRTKQVFIVSEVQG